MREGPNFPAHFELAQCATPEGRDKSDALEFLGTEAGSDHEDFVRVAILRSFDTVSGIQSSSCNKQFQTTSDLFQLNALAKLSLLPKRVALSKLWSKSVEQTLS